jgi:hypothetical protein
MTSLRSSVVAALAGAASWSAAEYGLHRFAMHELRGKGLASVEHLKHHADVTYFSPTSKKLLSAAGTSSVTFPLAGWLAGRRWATAFTGGMVAMYAAYEVAHRRIHTHPPRNRYGRWTRRNHLYHHFGSPMRNFGVTSSIWDRMFRSGDELEVIAVPRRMAPVWMLDDAGEVHAEFTADYLVKGVRDAEASQVDRDRVDAFANVAPGA